MRTMWTPEKEAKFLEALSDTCNVSDACRIASVARSTAYERRDEDTEFAKGWDRSVRIGAETLEDEAFRRARDGVDEPVFYQGAVCGTVKKYSDTLLIFLLKGAKPVKYRERCEEKAASKEEVIKRVIVNL